MTIVTTVEDDKVYIDFDKLREIVEEYIISGDVNHTIIGRSLTFDDSSNPQDRDRINDWVRDDIDFIENAILWYANVKNQDNHSNK